MTTTKAVDFFFTGLNGILSKHSKLVDHLFIQSTEPTTIQMYVRVALKQNSTPTIGFRSC